MNFGHSHHTTPRGRLGPAVFGPAIPIIAIAATVASTAVAGYGAIQSASASSQAANYQAQVAKNNASIASSNAAYAQNAGAVAEQNQALKTRAAIGSVITQEAANGLDVNTGSNLNVRQSTAAMGTQSELNIRNNTARQAYGYKTQQQGYIQQAGLDTTTAENATTAGGISAFGDLVGGVASSATLYEHLARTGAFEPNAPTLW